MVWFDYMQKLQQMDLIFQNTVLHESQYYYYYYYFFLVFLLLLLLLLFSGLYILESKFNSLQTKPLNPNQKKQKKQSTQKNHCLTQHVTLSISIHVKMSLN